jgi:uncharacterized Zn finger protein
MADYRYVECTEPALVEAEFACPGCSERRQDELMELDAGDYVRCLTCGEEYEPGA